MTENAIREDSCRAIAKRKLITQFKRAGISKAELSRRAGVSASTITAATAGKPLRLASADAISEALGYTRKELFAVQNDPTSLAKKTILEHHRLISTILSQADKELLIPYNPASKATPHMKRFVKCFFELLTQIIVKVRKCKVQRVCVLHFQLAGSGGCFLLMKLYH